MIRCINKKEVMCLMKWCKDDVYRILFNQLRSFYWISEDEIEMVDECIMGTNQAGKQTGLGVIGDSIGHSCVGGGGRLAG